MEPIIIWQNYWGANPMVPLYLFFGGMTAGTFTIAVLADYLAEKVPGMGGVSKIAAYVSVPSYIAAGLLITFHLGRPIRGLLFPIYFTNYGSWMTLGGWAMGFAAILAVVYGGMHYIDYNAKTRRLVGLVGIPFMIWMAVNTAFLLSGSMFVPLWSQLYLPFLFVNSGLLTGWAAVGLIVMLMLAYRPQESMGNLSGAVHYISYGVLAFELLEILILFIFLNFLASSTDAPIRIGEFVLPNGSRAAYEYLVTGPLATWFWVGVILLGLAIPLVLSLMALFYRKWENAITYPKFALVILGGVVLRFVIVWGGDLKAPLPFPPALSAIPGLF